MRIDRNWLSEWRKLLRVASLSFAHLASLAERDEGGRVPALLGPRAQARGWLLVNSLAPLDGLEHAHHPQLHIRLLAMPLNAHAAARLRNKKRGGTSSTRTASSSSSTATSSKAQPKAAPRFRPTATRDLQWKRLVLPAEIGFDDDGGLLEVDEIDGVDVVVEDGRAVFKVRFRSPNSVALPSRS